MVQFIYSVNLFTVPGIQCVVYTIEYEVVIVLFLYKQSMLMLQLNNTKCVLPGMRCVVFASVSAETSHCFTSYQHDYNNTLEGLSN